MDKYYSHKGKELYPHSNGVYKKSTRRGIESDNKYYISNFHDIGKLNPEFLNKLNGFNFEYSNHSYLSLYVLLNVLIHQREKHPKIFSNKIDINIISNIISSHHGNLKNIEEILNQDEIDGMRTVIDDVKIKATKYLNEFYPEMIDENFKFKLTIDGFYQLVVNKEYKDIWSKNPIKNFYDTIFEFSELVEADKRDASNNEVYIMDDISKFNYLFDNNINSFLKKLTSDREINKVRTDIRVESVNNLNKLLKTTDERIFEVTAPTGSGKTFMLLKLANTIQKNKGDYGVILALPFNSIIDQTSDICSKSLMIDVLNYTSASNSSPIMDKFAEDAKQKDYAKNKDLLKYVFSEDSFDYPFVVTTFVQFFQTLISNKNSTLIKLPNFSKKIFLIDEFQSLSPNLYTFFYGILKYFCDRFDCYCILSTATMPNFNLNTDSLKGKIADRVFNNYKIPTPIINSNYYYQLDVFDRYMIKNIADKNKTELIGLIDTQAKGNSVLIIMNTIKDSIMAYSGIEHENKYLLNSNFTPEDKITIINKVREDLEQNKRVLLVTTQIIQAGVDLDFPIVFRDACSLPDLIQSCGRANRNGLFEKGIIYLFNLYEMQGEFKYYSSRRIYDGFDINFVNRKIKEVSEKQLYSIQKTYYNEINKHKTIGKAKINSEDVNLLDLLCEGKIHDLGNFRLISEEKITYFVGDEIMWKDYSDTFSRIQVQPFSYENSHILKQKQKDISRYFVSIKKTQELPYTEEIMGIRNLEDKTLYSSKTGIDLSSVKKS